MKKSKTKTSVCNVITAVSTRVRSGRFVAAAGLILLVTAGAAWGQPSEVAKLLASDGAVLDRFGASVSISGDTAIVGAFTDNHSGFLDAGSAYIYQRDWGGPNNWGQVGQPLRDDFPAEADWFGKSVSISGDIAIVGTPLDDDACPGNPFCNSGSVFIFYRDQDGPDQWGQVAKLTADDAKNGDQFGRSVSISGDFAIVGSPFDEHHGTLNPGSAYIFYRNFPSNDQWGQVAKLTASDFFEGDFLGFSVSISGDVAVLGAHYDDDNGLNSGSAYVFVRPPGGWVDMTQTAKLTASDGAVNDQFGWSVAISGEVAVVGALLDDDNGIESGSAYAFHEPPGGWVDMTEETAKLTASDGAASDHFGSSVSIRGEVAVVGAVSHDDNGTNSGSAYVFRFDGISWTETAKLTASDGQAGDGFGTVSISGDLATVGALHDNDNGFKSGSAYVFDGVCPCPWDLDGDGGVGVKDLLFLLGNWGSCADCFDCPADFDGSCDVGVIDLLALLGRWGSCPCDEGPPPLSFEEELDEACVTQENWDEFEAVMDDATASQAEKDNYLCWMSHYLEDCSRCSCTGALCPGPDPFDD